jgi:hypothetical protein
VTPNIARKVRDRCAEQHVGPVQARVRTPKLTGPLRGKFPFHAGCFVGCHRTFLGSHLLLRSHRGAYIVLLLLRNRRMPWAKRPMFGRVRLR